MRILYKLKTGRNADLRLRTIRILLFRTADKSCCLDNTFFEIALYHSPFLPLNEGKHTQIF